MRRDTEIGVIAAIVLAIIIGVFISTRPRVKEPTIPLSHKYEERDAGSKALDSDKLTQSASGGLEIAELPEERPEETVPATALQPETQEQEEEIVEGEWEEIEAPATTVAKETMPALAEVKEPQADIREGKDVIHTVRPNDTLAKLARQYYGNETMWTQIYNANIGKISHRNALFVGQKIVVPDVSTPAEKPPVAEQIPSPPRQTPVAPKEASKHTHTVQKGDTLFKLARQYYNSEGEWRKIYEANKDVIQNPNAISQGTVLIIPE